MIDNLAGTVSERTMEIYTKAWDDYREFCASLGLEVYSAGSVLEWRKRLAASPYSPNTINTSLSAIKSIFKASMASGQVTIEVYTQVRAIAQVSVRAMRDRLRPDKDVLSDLTVMAIIDGIDVSTLKGWRDRAVISLLATTGMRIEELCLLRSSDVDLQAKTVMVRGKTDIRPRAVPLSGLAERALVTWFFMRNMTSAWVFNSLEGRSQVVQDKPISTVGAYNLVVAAAKTVGVNISCHDFRRYVATRLAQENIVSAQALLGHRSIITTQRYVKRLPMPSVEWLG